MFWPSALQRYDKTPAQWPNQSKDQIRWEADNVNVHPPQALFQPLLFPSWLGPASKTTWWKIWTERKSDIGQLPRVGTQWCNFSVTKHSGISRASVFNLVVLSHLQFKSSTFRGHDFTKVQKKQLNSFNKFAQICNNCHLSKNKAAAALRARFNLSSESTASFFHSANT